jgi:hypothetical protein
VEFRIAVYTKFSGSLNRDPLKRSAVWENPKEDDPRIQPLRATLDAGIESNKLLQRVTALLKPQDQLDSEKLTAKMAKMVIGPAGK